MRTRLHTGCLMLGSLLCVSITHGSATERILDYDNAAGVLHFSCPLESEMRDKKLLMANFGRYNQRTTNGETSRFAKWFNHTATKFENGTVLNNTRLMGLTGFLKDVRCEDSQMYYCSYHYTLPSGHIERRVENITFRFEGKPSVSIAKPSQSRHCAGDTIELKCRAHLGRQNNAIVWETKVPGELQFSADTGKTNHSVPMDTKNCNYYSESTITRHLTTADNERAWRCRLTYGDAEDVVVIAVDDNKEPCLKAPGESTTAGRPDHNLRVLPSTDDKRSPLEGPNHSAVITILATVIPISMLILIVIVALIILKRHPKQLPPIVLLPDGPPPSEYSFSAVAGRGLPPLPQVQSNDYLFSAAREKSNEPPPPLPPYYQPKENADQSVYVSMSAIPSSYETASTSCNSAGMSESGRLWEDSDDQGMRTERSESTYSNKEAIERAKTLAQAKAKNYNALDLLPLQLDGE